MNSKVMIVDDDPSIVYTVVEILEPEGFEVVTASGGEECLGEMEKGFQGMILMDIMMPEMNGWETIRQIVDRGYLDGTIISMLTARDIEDEKEESLAPYVTNYIMKPFDPDELVATIREYLTLLR